MNFDAERQRLLDIFRAFDSNCDGQLDQYELVEGYSVFFNGDRRRAEYEVREMMEKLDFNNNGTIDYSEFLIANIDPNKLIQEDKLKEVFEMFDVDHSGTISAEKLKKILGGKGVSEVDESEWERIVEEVDVDGDGVISYDEFRLIIYTLLNLQVPPDLEEQYQKELIK